MRRASLFATIAAAAGLATPAMALPNVFWIFGWDMPGRAVPWHFGEAAPAEAVATAAVEPGVPGIAAAPTYPTASVRGGRFIRAGYVVPAAPLFADVTPLLAYEMDGL